MGNLSKRTLTHRTFRAEFLLQAGRNRIVLELEAGNFRPNVLQLGPRSPMEILGHATFLSAIPYSGRPDSRDGPARA